MAPWSAASRAKILPRSGLPRTLIYSVALDDPPAGCGSCGAEARFANLAVRLAMGAAGSFDGVRFAHVAYAIVDGREREGVPEIATTPNRPAPGGRAAYPPMKSERASKEQTRETHTGRIRQNQSKLTFVFAALLFNVQTMTRLESVRNITNGFDFEYFERMKGDQAQIARTFLLERFPINSEAKVAVEYVQAGGAKCTFTGDREYKYYFCHYTRVGRGLMALVSSIDWKIILITDDSGSVLQNISVGREVSGS